MTVEENLRVIERYLEAFTMQEADRLAGFYTESSLYQGPGLPEPLRGPSAIIENFRGFWSAFPDLRFEKERAFGQGDWLCVEGTGTGTHTGPLTSPDGETIPATNRKIQFKLCTVYKVVGGKVMEDHDYFDQLGFMAQLGLAP